ATLSARVIADLLRGELGYDGYVVSDDLEMKAIVDHYSVGRAAVMSILAGCDGCLVCATPSLIREAHDELARAIASGEVTSAMVAGAWRRREKLLSKSRRLARIPSRGGAIGAPEHASLNDRLRGETRSLAAKA